MQTESRSFDEILVCSNIAGALFFGALLYVLKNWASMKPANDSTYLCLRNMYRVVDFLGLQSQNPVVTSAVRRELPTRFEQLGAEVFVILTWLGITAAASLLLYLMRHTGIYRMVGGFGRLFTLHILGLCSLVRDSRTAFPHPCSRCDSRTAAGPGLDVHAAGKTV
jgi:hypothetical protein